MFFIYKGITEDKKYKRGYIEADSSVDAVSLLKETEKIISVISLVQTKNNSFTQFRLKVNSKVEAFENKINDKTLDYIRKTEERKAEKNKSKKKKRRKEGKTLAEKSPILAGINKLSSSIRGEKVVEARDVHKEEIDKMFVIEEAKNTKESFENNKRNLDKGEALDISLLEAEVSPEAKKNMKIKISEKELTMFTRRLHIMISSGMSLLNALISLQNSTEKKLSSVVSSIAEDIQKGTTFSEALAKFPRQFDATYVSLVSIGEKSGSLDKSLKDIIKVRDQRAKIANKLKVASMYPIVIGIVLALLMAAAFLFFLPKFEEMYSEQEMEMPMFSQIVFKIAGIFPVLALAFAVIFGTYFFLKKRVPEIEFLHRRVVDKMLLKFPVVSKVTNASYMFTFSSTIALMLDNGIRLSDTLELTKRTIKNIYVKSEIEKVSSLMIHGESFSSSLKNQEYFDETLVNIVNTGEKSGRMVYSLEQVSSFYNDELTRQVDSALELVQPVSIMLIAIVLAPIIVAAYLPILEISSGGVSGFN